VIAFIGYFKIDKRLVKAGASYHHGHLAWNEFSSQYFCSELDEISRKHEHIGSPPIMNLP